MVNGSFIGKIQSQGLYIMQLLSPFGTGFGGTSSGTSTDMTLSLGLPLILGLALVCYCLLTQHSEKDRYFSILYTAAGFFVFTVFLSLHIFPWDYVQSALGRTAGKLAGMFQYPWRFLSLATVLLCLATLIAIRLLAGQHQALGRAAAVVLAASALLMTGVMQAQILTEQGEVPRNVYSVADPSVTVAIGEYIIDGTSAYETIWAQPKPASGDLHLISYEKREGVAYVSVENDGGEAAISLPIYNYGNYYAADESGAPFAITSGENMRIVLTIPAGYTGTIHVRYHAPGYWRAFEVLSAVSLLGVIGCGAFARRKRRTPATV